MGRTSLEVRFLKKVPKRYLEDRIYVPDEVAGLDSVYYEPPRDAWHCKIRVKTHEWRMDDLGKYIKRQRPQLDMSIWSMHMDYPGRAVASVGSERIVVEKDVLESLKHDYIDTRDFCLCLDSRSLDLGYLDKDWLQDLLPGYLNIRMLKALAAARFQCSRNLTVEDLDGRLGEYDYSSCLPDVMGFLADCAAYGVKKRLEAYAYLGD